MGDETGSVEEDAEKEGDKDTAVFDGMMFDKEEYIILEDFPFCSHSRAKEKVNDKAKGVDETLHEVFEIDVVSKLEKVRLSFPS